MVHKGNPLHLHGVADLAATRAARHASSTARRDRAPAC